MVPSGVQTAHTADGWSLPVRRYAASGPPVVLVHGMGVTHHNFDYHPDVSLAHTLQQAGFDVWVPTLRGDPGTVAPSLSADQGFTFDGYARQDIPAILDVITEETGAAQVHWVGHSMGGILLYTSLQQFPERIASGVAVSSPVAFVDQNVLHRMTVMGASVMRRDRRMPMSRLGRHLLPRGVVARQLGNVRNMDPAVTRGLATHSVVDMSTEISHQAAQWLRSRTLLTLEGTPWLTSAPSVPLLVMGGDRDRIVPPENVSQACDVFPECSFVLLSPETGFSASYGHIDPLLSAAGRAEVFPLITGFLLSQDW